MRKYLYALALLAIGAFAAYAAGETQLLWGLTPGSNPRSACVFETGSATCDAFLNLDQTAHTAVIQSTSIPTPTASTLGGVQSATAGANQFQTGINTSGVPTFAQPAFSNLSGSATCAQLPALTSDVTTSAGSCTTTIAAGAVTAAKMANFNANSVLCNNTGSPATAIYCTQAQLTAFINQVTAALAGTIPAFPNDATKFFRGDGTYNTAVTSVICATTTITTSGTCYSRGQVVGTNTNDNATAGNIGEFVSASVASGSAVALTGGTPANITSISLTAGDWDVEGTIWVNPAGTTTVASVNGWVSSTSATAPAFGSEGSGLFAGTTTGAGVAPPSVFSGQKRFSLSATTTVFLSVNAIFSVSTAGGYGFIKARRVR